MSKAHTIGESVSPLTKRVWEYFEKFSAIYPRRSADEELAAEYVATTAESFQKNGLVNQVIRQYETIGGRDIHNVIVKKNATPGYEDKQPIILQAHMDMVCEPNGKTEEHDFDNEPILMYEFEGDDGKRYVKATISEDGGKVDTTLGADDGIGVACILAILEAGPDQVSHPPIEAIFTSDEEAQMSGAENIKNIKDCLKAKRMINIDTEQEGMFFNGCAGGLNIKSSIKLAMEKPTVQLSHFTLSVTGLLGGHSGLMIGERRANANRLLGRVLDRLQEKLGDKIYLNSIKGGEYPNAIPAACSAKIAVDATCVATLENIVKQMFTIFKEEYKGTDANPAINDNVMSLDLEPESFGEMEFMTVDTLNKVITLLTSLPNGVIAMHTEFPKDGDDLVETSSNMGMVYCNQQTFEVVCFARSCFESKIDMLERRIRCIVGHLDKDASIAVSSRFPAWSPNSDSQIRHALENIYRDEFKKDAETKSIHAGLECGYFVEAIDGLDCIAIGPTIHGAHTPKEQLEIETVDLITRLLVRALKDIDDQSHNTQMDKACVKATHRHHLNCMCMR